MLKIAMSNINIYNQKGEKTGDVKLSDKIFNIKVSEDLVHQAVVAQMGNERQVLAHTKQRADVRGGGKKPWKQKGTGRARAGSTRSPIWIGGGVTFGPLKTRNFSKKINKKMKQKALFMALSDKLSSDNLFILDKLEVENFKTKVFNNILINLEKLYKKPEAAKKDDKKPSAPADAKTVADKKTSADKKVKRSTLIIDSKKEDKAKFSARNLVGIKLINLNNINIVDLLKYRYLVITSDAVKKLEEKYK